MWIPLTHHPAEIRSIVKGSAARERLGVMRPVPLHQDTVHSALEALEEEDMEEVEIFVEEITVEEDLAEAADLVEVLDVAEVTVEEVEDLVEAEGLVGALDVVEITVEAEDLVVEASPTVEEVRAMLDPTQDITLDARVDPVHLQVVPRGEDSIITMEGLLVGLGLGVTLLPVSSRPGRRKKDKAMCSSYSFRVSQSHNLLISQVVLDGNIIKK